MAMKRISEVFIYKEEKKLCQREVYDTSAMKILNCRRDLDSRNVVPSLDFIRPIFAMKCFGNFYILILALTKIVVLCKAEFEDMELTHLSQKLNPIECLRLLEAMYLKKPMSDEEFEQSESKITLDDESLLRRQLEKPFLSHENCRVKLEEWRRNLPEKSDRWARIAMETVLRSLGRPDLAKYIKRNRRLVEYLEEDSRLMRNAGKKTTFSRPTVSKNSRTTMIEKKYKGSPKEAVIQVYRTAETEKRKDGLRKSDEMQGARSGAQRSNDEDSTTRWTAFLILLGLIGLTILATVIFALYKNNRGKIFSFGDKNLDDCCPLADRVIRKPSSPDVEQGESASSRCGRKKKRGSSSQGQSRSPSSTCPREKCKPIRKPKMKFLKDGQQQARKLVKRRKRRCEKNCSGIKKDDPPVPKIDKSTKTKRRETSEKSNQIAPSKAPRDRKKFHERLANILKKENPPCKCCKCSVFSNSDDAKDSEKKNLCTDDKCQKRRLKSIAELCLSSEESTRKESEIDSNRRKKKKKKKKKVKETEKENDKTSPENSARSKDKRDSKIIEKPIKRRKCDAIEACTKKTCSFRKSRGDENSTVGNNV